MHKSYAHDIFEYVCIQKRHACMIIVHYRAWKQSCIRYTYIDYVCDLDSELQLALWHLNHVSAAFCASGSRPRRWTGVGFRNAAYIGSVLVYVGIGIPPRKVAWVVGMIGWHFLHLRFTHKMLSFPDWSWLILLVLLDCLKCPWQANTAALQQAC